jgi:glycosyltransferase involved in cell wall biosynthesis
VVFTGFVPLEEKVLYYSMADVFALWSVHEPPSRFLLEAMSAGIPIVAFKSPGVAEIVPATAGVLLEDSSILLKDRARTMKEAIGQLLSDERKARELREKARDHVIQNYDVKVVLPRIERVYESLRSKNS